MAVRTTNLEVNVSILVGVEGPECMVAELLAVAAREQHFVHVHELRRRQLPIRTVLLLTPYMDMQERRNTTLVISQEKSLVKVLTHYLNKNVYCCTISDYRG
jgi:hypothetical protein